MRPYPSLLSSRSQARPILFALALVACAAPVATAQSSDSNASSDQSSIQVEVRIDPSKTGDERCVIEPEDLEIPTGVSTVTWSLVQEELGASSERNAPRLDTVGFNSSVPVVGSERLGAQRWRATFDRQRAFSQTPYDVLVREADGTVLDCYPHVAGSTDQGGG